MDGPPDPDPSPGASPPGRLVLVATPIGNLDDLSPRAVRALREADVVAAEDTRRTGRLLRHLGIDVPMVSHHDHNEDARVRGLVDRAAAGGTVAVVTDAGTPGLADPGFAVTREAIARGVRVEAVPGPAAALHALVLSGLPMDRFVFEGFLPRRAGARRERLAVLADERRTLVLYVSPHRAVDELDAVAAALGGDRPAALARELTKLHEEVRRGTLATLAAAARSGLRGELTLVVGGAAEEPAAVGDAELVERVRALVATGVDRRTATREVAAAAGVPKRRVYQAVVDAGGRGGPGD